MREDWMRTTPPSLLSLTIDTAVLHLSNFSDLSSIPDHIILDLFLVLLFSSLPLFISEEVISRFRSI
jgi:reversibly glycosylated polypeptide/UDP-arabinopyranose mutase